MILIYKYGEKIRKNFDLILASIESERNGKEIVYSYLNGAPKDSFIDIGTFANKLERDLKSFEAYSGYKFIDGVFYNEDYGVIYGKVAEDNNFAMTVRYGVDIPRLKGKGNVTWFSV